MMAIPTLRSPILMKNNLLLSTALSLLIAIPVLAADKMATLRAKIEGTYELTEWDDAGIKLTPPAVAARFVIRDGKLTWIAHKKVGDKQVSTAQYGDYVLSENVFAYGYGEWLEAVIEGEHQHVSREAKQEMKAMTLPSMRSFTLTLENNIVRAVAGPASFEFRDDGLDYTHKTSGFTRRYRRVGN